jgi:hypothetical protein
MLERYSEERQIREGSAHAVDGMTALPCEYAKYKNPPYLFCKRPRSIDRSGFGGGPAMPDDPASGKATASVPPREPLTPEAQRALAEAEARRAAAANAPPMPKEFGGPKGPEPTRYGDWENKGIASDF